MPATVPSLTSPCVGVCVLDEATRLCRGCLRTIDEVAVWQEADDALRGDILERVRARRLEHGAHLP